MKNYNIIYLHSHDTGRYIQPYGYSIPTPNLQKFAEESVLFRQNFSANPTCSPSKAALLTGTYPCQNGMFGLEHHGFKLNDPGKHLANTLKQHGYTTGLAGIQHVFERDNKTYKEMGYDFCPDIFIWLDHSKYPDMDKEDISVIQRDTIRPGIINNAVEFIENNKNKPFFLSVGFQDTHRPYPRFDRITENPKYCRAPAQFPDTPETREDMAGFMSTARNLDTAMGTIIDTVKKNGLEDNTLIICTTDHGIAFPKMKCTLYDSGTGTMLMIRGPEGFEGGKVIDALTSHLDVYPTVCDVLDIKKPDWLEGKSLMPLVKGEKEDIHDAVFTELNFHTCYAPYRAVRTKRWKYIKKFHNRKNLFEFHCNNGYCKNEYLKNNYPEIEIPEEQLFDLFFDPNEANNLVYKQEYKDILSELKEMLNDWMEKVDDPLLNSHILPPKGTKVKSPDTGEYISY